jgi:hypothetical protein
MPTEGTIGRMTPTKTDTPWWVKALTDAVKSFGVTTVIVFVLMYVSVYQLLPMLKDMSVRYMNAVEATQKDLSSTQRSLIENQKMMVKNQESLVETQEQLVTIVSDVSIAAQSIVAKCDESLDFQNMVVDQHDMQMKKLEDIEKAVVPQ